MGEILSKCINIFKQGQKFYGFQGNHFRYCFEAFHLHHNPKYPNIWECLWRPKTHIFINIAGVVNILDGVEAVGGVRATEKPPPQTIGGKPCRIFLPPPTTCIDNQQEGRLAENSAHPGVGRIQRQATGPPQHTPWGVIPGIFFTETWVCLPPCGRTPCKVFTALPSPEGYSSRPGLSECPPWPPSSPSTSPPPHARQLAEGRTHGQFFQEPLGVPHPGGEPWRNISIRPNPVSAHPGHQPNQPPPLMHALQ